VTEASGLDSFVAVLLANHEDALADRRGFGHRLREDQAHRLAIRRYAEIAEVDRKAAGRAVRRLHRQLFLLDDRVGGVLDPAHVGPVAEALVRRSLGVIDDVVVEEAETTYLRIEEVRRQIPLSWSLKRVRGTEPEDEGMRALERELDVLERRYAEIWVRWCTG
jgi:hypothetical protein